MAYSIRPHRIFERTLAMLSKELQRRVVEKFEFRAAHPETIGPPMRHLPADLRGLRKDRVGDWRIFSGLIMGSAKSCPMTWMHETMRINVFKTAMQNQMSYEPEADVLRIDTGHQPIEYAAEIGNVIVHFSPSGIPVYFEILEATKFLKRASTLLRPTPRQILTPAR